MQRISLDEDGARVETLGAEPFRLPFREVVLSLLWSLDEGAADAVRGHGYLLDRGSGPLELVRIAHEAADHGEMMALYEALKARVPPAAGAARLRANTPWTEPTERRWSFTADAGTLAAALRGRVLLERAGADLNHLAEPTSLPVSFLRDPVRSILRELVGEIRWPDEWDASALRPRFVAARSGMTVAVTGCRYGSIHAGAGQDRTAAVMVSEDGGETFDELPWQLDESQRATPAGRWCWPPEQILRVVPGTDGLSIEWEDPWILFDPGDEWAARWDAGRREWRMWTR